MMRIDRRRWSGAVALGALGAWVSPTAAIGAGRDAAAAAAPGSNILHVPFPVAETCFDPPRISDLYSHRIIGHIFEAPYRYDPLAVQVKPLPLTAAAMPEVSADFRTWRIRIRPGIFFADDPAFKGKPRELVAEDYVYAIKRYFDPETKSPYQSLLAEDAILGMQELRDAAIKGRKRFDYDTPIEGLRALDRYTFQARLAKPRPRFLANLCDSSLLGAVTREVVEAYGDDIPAHPVGTGPYRLKEWRRSSKIILERNPTFRDMRYDAQPNADDIQGQAWLAKLKGKRLPLNDGVEVSILEEDQARWLSFLNGQIDYLSVPLSFGSIAAPNGKLASNLVKQGITARRYPNPDFTFVFFNMDDPVVGGYTAEKVALRRAVNLAYDIDREIRLLRRNQAIPAQAAMPPGTFGYDPAYRSEMSRYDPARAKALLDLYGYIDRDGDGWRELPNGQPLVLQLSTQSSQIDRQSNEIWQKSLQAVGLRIRFVPAQWPENLKAARAGSLQMWTLADSATVPDGQPSIEYFYGPSAGANNLARFRLPAFDRIYERMQTMPDGPERAALFLEASNLVAAYMPYRTQVHRLLTDLSQPWITGWRQGQFRAESWQFTEIDAGMRARLTAQSA